MAAKIGSRIKALREGRGQSQDDVARLFGFKDRQTLSAIETGERKVSAEELVRAAELFGVQLDYFTDPFLLAGEGSFSWRQSGVKPATLADCEIDAGRLIAAFRTLGPKVGREAPLLRRSLGLNKQSRIEEAAAAGERFAADYQLGDIPASRLADVMERELGLLVLMVDPIKGVSGAACRLPELDAVLINRREIAGRRHFDLAHELFHILTWDAMPPEHIEEVAPKTRTRVEQLADSFASAVLMPATALDRFGDWTTLQDDKLIARLNATADELLVSASALRWRLVSLGRLDKAVGSRVPENRLRHNGRPKPAEGTLAPLFSKSFIEVIGRAIDQGGVTVRRVSYLLALSIDDLADLFKTYGVEAPFAL
jgi:Zn-dependent peptidase ImmA (M78 family)/transcriptional regulator with XRE-family HTH domain